MKIPYEAITASLTRILERSEKNDVSTAAAAEIRRQVIWINAILLDLKKREERG